MDYPLPMHHQVPHSSQSAMHHPQHPLLSNQLQPMNPASHTSMWLDDPYSGSTACPSQRDSGFNSRPASLRSVDSTGTGGSIHHAPANSYEQMPPSMTIKQEHEHIQPQYTEMQTVPPPPGSNKPDPAQFIPELLGLLMEEDPVIVREAVLVTHMMIKEGGESRSEVIRNRDVSKRIDDWATHERRLASSSSFTHCWRRSPKTRATERLPMLWRTSSIHFRNSKKAYVPSSSVVEFRD